MSTINPKIGYYSRAKNQGLKWINGISEHNNIDDECCPDFSCCVPELFETDPEKRRYEFAAWIEKHKPQAANDDGSRTGRI